MLYIALISALWFTSSARAFVETSTTCESLLTRTEPAPTLAERYADLEDPIHQELSENLYDLQREISPEYAGEWNKALIKTLVEMPMPTRNPKRKAGLTRGEVEALFWKIRNNDFAAVGSLHRKKYDPTGETGFCFGRAFLAHVEALNLGLAKDSIRKVWIVGAQAVGKRTWKHHVATMVRGTDGTWWVLDPLSRDLLALPDWLEYFQTNHPGEGTQLFATHPKRFSPSDARAMLPGTVRNPAFRRYFENLLEVYRAEARTLVRARFGSVECTNELTVWRCLKQTLGF